MEADVESFKKKSGLMQVDRNTDTVILCFFGTTGGILEAGQGIFYT